MRFLVTGGTGKVGSALVHRLREAGHEAVAAARNPGPDGLRLDFARTETLASVPGDLDGVFLNTPVGPNETEQGLSALRELRKRSAKKVVALGIMNVEPMQEIPHFAAKIPIRDAVLADDRSVVLAANYFFQNDLMALDAIVQGGVFPLPVGDAGVAAVDVRDVAEAGFRALTKDDWNGREVPVCGAETITATRMAQTWAGALGSPVIYPGDDVSAFRAGLSTAEPGMDPWVVEDLTTMMEVTQRLGCPASATQIALASEVIGAGQRRYQDFVEETATQLGR